MKIGYGQLDMVNLVVMLASESRLNIRHCWNFFESGHGKGEHDGVGACVKKTLQIWKIIHSSM